MSHQKFYTNCTCVGNNILYRGVENGERVSRKFTVQPTLFLPSSKPTKYKTLDGRYADKIKFGDIGEAKEFVRRYEGVDNFVYFGNTKYHYVYLGDEFPEYVDYDMSEIVIANIDIEVASEGGFAPPENPTEEVIAITVESKGTYVVFGCGDFTTKEDSIKYIRCKNEVDLLQRFMEHWEHIAPDVVTGWNIQFYDIPYLVNRISKVFGDKEAKRLSPWRYLSTRKAYYKGRHQVAVELVGVSTLDYMEMYRKFQPKQESEKLNYIAYVELGEKKISYEEYDSLHSLYKNNYQKFIEYNIKDVELIKKLEEKLKLIEMCCALAYDARVNFTDVFAQVRMWDTIIYNDLKKKNIVLPRLSDNEKDTEYAGAYVKEVTPGMYEWVVSFDLNSLYPNLIAQFNISPECLVTDKYRQVNIKSLLNREFDTSSLKSEGVSLAANGHCFNNDRIGFLPDILMRMYEDRKTYKKKMLEAQQELETLKEDLHKPHNIDNVELKAKARKLSFDISKYHNFQLTKKIQLNSAYGAMGNQYFRFYDIRLAEAVTLSGQLVIQWIAKDINAYLNNLLKTSSVDYVIAIDTDSIYLNLKNLVTTAYGDKLPDDKIKIVDFLDKVANTKIQSIIDKSCKDLREYLNARSQKMQMKRESIADKAIWTAKKRYILNVYDNEGVRYETPKLKIQGIEAVKSSTPEVCRQKIKDAINIILTKSQTELHQYIDGFKSEFKSLSPETVAFPRGCNGISTYADVKTIYGKGTPIHVRGALVYNKLIKEKKLEKKYPCIQEGDKIKFLYLKTPNHIQQNVITMSENGLPQELNLHKYVDYELQFEKTFLDPLKIILDAINWSTKKTMSFDDL